MGLCGEKFSIFKQYFFLYKKLNILLKIFIVLNLYILNIKKRKFSKENIYNFTIVTPIPQNPRVRNSWRYHPMWKKEKIVFQSIS